MEVDPAAKEGSNLVDSCLSWLDSDARSAEYSGLPGLAGGVTMPP